VCDRLETDGWAVEDATPVTVPLALMPFDPGRIPKTVLAHLYARHPEIETYCFLVRARRAGARPLRARPAARPPSADFPTMPWKTEAEWGEEARRRPDGVADAVRALEETAGRLESVRLDLVRSDEELLRIKSSLTWRAVVKYRTLRERLMRVAPGRDQARPLEAASMRGPTREDRPAEARVGDGSDVLRASVVVCTHNGGRLVEETLESLVCQDFPPAAFEILVVDNASTDATPDVVRGMAERHPGRIRLVREPVLGHSSARNRGVRESRGDVIAFTDDDARVTPGWLRALVDTCERPQVGCAGGPVRAVLVEPLPEWVTPPFLPYLALFEKGTEEVGLSYNEYPRGVNMAFPRQSFREVGLFSTAFGLKGPSLLYYDEIELCYRLERLGRRILYVPEAVVNHAIHAERLTVAWFTRRFYSQGKTEAYFDLVTVDGGSW
jgi:GT2 family glycosyltransferase